MSHRTYFMDHAILYLFSADIEFSMAYEQIGLVPSGARFNLLCAPNTARVYNVLRERSVGLPGYQAVTGTIIWGEDAALMGEDDVAFANVRATIQTDDGAAIESTYRGVMPTGMGVFRAIAGGADLLGSARNPAEYSLVVTPTYETSAPQYKWLTEQQCVGFGTVQEVAGMFRRVTYDIFAMT
jgi:hypothetical protein